MKVDTLMTIEKAKVDQARLDMIEKHEGRAANWHVANVMMKARRVMDLLPSNAKPVVDLNAFHAAMADYGDAVKGMDSYGAGKPNAFFVFASQPRSLLSKLRDFQAAVDRVKGDARRGGGDQLTWIVNDYNMMVTTSQNATMFNSLTRAAMKPILRTFIASSALALVHLGVATAGPYEDGQAAYDRGDYAAALQLRLPLAEQGDPRAQTDIGAMYEKGQGVVQDYATAVTWYRKAAEQGDARAETNLGDMYERGFGVEKDEAQAFALFSKAAEQGYAWAQNNLGNFYAEGRGVAKDDAQALAWYRKAAEQGLAHAQLSLGFDYLNGRSVEKDSSQAVVWYRKAADQNYTMAAEFMLGSHLLPLAPRRAAGLCRRETKWFQKAAEQGSWEAQRCELARAYAKGRGVPQDYALAVQWWRKAADQGFARSQFALGELYAQGDGVPKDNVQAHMWFSLAASHAPDAALRGRPAAAAAERRERAAAARDRLAEQMTPDEIARARQAGARNGRRNERIRRIGRGRARAGLARPALRSVHPGVTFLIHLAARGLR